MDFWKRRTTPTKATLTKDDDVAGREGKEEEKKDEETEEKTRRRNVLVASTTCVVTVGAAGAMRAAGAKAQKEPANNVYDFTVSQYGKLVSLGKYRGKVTAIVNVASE